MEVRQGDTAVHGVPPVRKFIVGIKPRIKVLFAVFKLDKKERANREPNRKSKNKAQHLSTLRKINLTEATREFTPFTTQGGQELQNTDP